VSVGIRAGFSCSFSNGSAMGGQLTTRSELAGVTATLTTTIKALSDQMAALITKIDNININNRNDNNNRNYNNRNNQNRGGKPIRVS